MKYFVTSAFLMASSLVAQTPAINGSFFFEESGSTAQSGRRYQTVGLLKLDGQGTVTGSEFTREASSLGSRSVRGRYEFGADGIGAMNLQYSVLDAEGEAQTETANYRLALAKDGRMLMLCTDSGVLAEGELTPDGGTTGLLKGDFVVCEDNVDASRQGLLSQGAWKFDGNGGVEARLVVKSFYQSAALVLNGRLEAQGDGTLNLRLSTTAVTAEDGTVTDPVVMTYKLVPGAKTFDLLRLDAGISSSIEVLAK